MTYAAGPGQIRSVMGFFAQVLKMPGGLGSADRPAALYGDARGVIAPVFQPFQSVKQQRPCVLRSGKTYDTAHLR